MRHDFLDRYSRLNSPVHRIPAAAKLAVALIAVVTTVLLPISAWIYFVAVTIVTVGVATLSKIPPVFLIKRLALLEPFVLGVSVLAIFQPGGWTIFATILVKSTLCLSTMILLSSTTPFAELLRVLKRARVPALLVTTLALMYRYLFVLVDEAQRMHRARSSRTFARRRIPTWKSLGIVIGQLFVRSTERAERIYAAMCARGWK